METIASDGIWHAIVDGDATTKTLWHAIVNANGNAIAAPNGNAAEPKLAPTALDSNEAAGVDARDAASITDANDANQ